MATCDFTSNYHDYVKDSLEIFKCKETALASNKCKFHDEDYAFEHQDEVTDLLNQKIQDSIDYKIPILCIEYKIPKFEFENINFEIPVNFSNSEFFNDAIFDNCQFLKEADFSNTTFREDASFLNVNFHSDVSFEEAIIENEMTFQNSSFMKKTTFQYATIKKASFLNASFDDVDFTLTTFQEFISFLNANFNGKAFFRETAFTRGTDFSYSRFLTTAYFVETNFLEESDFRNMIFEKPTEVFFNTDLSWVSFLETDITKLKFGDKTRWSNREPDSKNYKIYDEWKIEQGIEPELSLENVMDVYRNLRENFDFYLKYEVSGEFFVREMELKRKYKENSESDIKKIQTRNKGEQIFSPLGIYNVISKYGHSLSRPVNISIPILSLFSVLFYFDSLADPELAKYSFHDLVLKAVFRSTGSFFPFYSFSETGYLDTMLRIILLPISVTFFVGLKRKLERKFRH